MINQLISRDLDQVRFGYPPGRGFRSSTLRDE